MMTFLLSFLLINFSFIAFSQERAPQAEPPYPEYPQPKRPHRNKRALERPMRKDSSGTYFYKTELKKSYPKNRPGVASPTKVYSDGSYDYGTDIKKYNPKKRQGVDSPTDIRSDGSYYYQKDKEQAPARKREGVELPTRIKSDGSYVYGDINNNTYNSTYYFSLGTLGPFPWTASNAGALSYQDVYSSQSKFLIAGGYEWKMFDFLGAISLKFDSGVMFGEGRGQFNGPKNVNTAAGLQPKETFQLYLFPNTLSLLYRFESSPSQSFIPYIEGGVGYFTFWERRTDDKKNSFGGAATLSGGAGLLISLKLFNRLLGTDSIDSDYGVNQSWFNLHYRRVIGLHSRKNLSSNMITAGVALGF